MVKLPTLLVSLLVGTSAIAASGGPDTYGYTWKDHLEPDGPVYNWIDITTTGTMVLGLGDDNVVGPFVMATDMPFYWYGRKNIWVGSNGYIAFNGGNLASPFPAIPTSGGVNDFIAGMTGDMTFLGVGNQGRCYVYDVPDSTVISWVGVPFWSPLAPTYTGSNSFQIILDKSNGVITVQIQEQTGLTQNNDLVMGIESVAGSIGLQHSNDVYPVANYALQYTPPPSSSLVVLDGIPLWNTDPTSGGIFWPRNGASYQMIAAAANIGNTNLTGITLRGDLFNSTGVTMITAQQVIGNIIPGLDTVVNFPPLWTPNPAGTYRFVSTVSGIANELVTTNNTRTQELVVVDTSTPTHDLKFTGAQDDLVGLSWNGGNGGVAMYIKPPYYPAYATATTVRIVSNTGLASYTMKVYDDDGPNGLPGTLLDSVMIPAAQVLTGDQVIPLTNPINITTGGVYVQWYMIGANINIAVDITPPFSLRSYEVIDGVWAEYRDRENQDFFLGLRLAQLPVYDVGCTGFFGLADGQDIGGQTAVRAWVTNFGNQPVSSFSVKYRYGNGPITTQNYSGTAVNPGQQTLVTFGSYFVPTADMTNELCAWTSMVDDATATNDTACVSIHTYVGIDDLDRIDVILSPNPARDHLVIQGLPAGRWDLEMMDATGRSVQHESSIAINGPLMWPVEQLSDGVYHLIVRQDNKAYRSRFVVRH
ncbi:MAG: T9SS type A sorting domain-containing protein [Flavobacteriales bacterium]|nr:T9SS type A sorting domain-containing protein [Flavobacteriales bacterium]